MRKSIECVELERFTNESGLRDGGLCIVFGDGTKQHIIFSGNSEDWVPGDKDLIYKDKGLELAAASGTPFVEIDLDLVAKVKRGLNL